MGHLDQLTNIWRAFSASYIKETPAKVKMMDIFLISIIANGLLQFVYCSLVGCVLRACVLG